MELTTSRRSIAGVRLTRRRALGGALSSGAVLLAACGGKRPQDDVVQQGTAVPPAPAPTAAPKPGGILSLRVTGNPPLDPYTNSASLSQSLAGFTMARLLKFKTDPDPAISSRYETESDLATRVETSPDGLTWTYRLRPARWQDIAPVSGRMVDSEDVRLSLERFRAEPKNSNRAAFGTEQSPLVEQVETPDARTVIFRLARPYGPFRVLTASPNHLWVMAKEIAAGVLDPAKQVIGAGPFIYDSAQPDIAVKLRRNPVYFDTPKPYVDGVNFSVIKDTAQEVAQFRAGRLDRLDVPVEQLDELRQSLPKASFIEYVSATYSFVALQQRGATPFRDERVRRAAQMAIDRDGLLRLGYRNKGFWNSAVPSVFSRWRVDPKSAAIGPGGRWYEHNPAESKKLLAAAGYPNGLTMRYIYTNNNYGDWFTQLAEAVFGMLGEAGFNLQIVTQDYQREYITPGTGTFFGNYEGAFFGIESAFLDPHDYVFNMLHSRSARNHAGVNDPQLDAMIDKEGATIDEDERIKLFQEIERYLAERVYYVTTAVGLQYVGAQEWLKNYCFNLGAPGYGTETFAKSWLDRG